MRKPFSIVLIAWLLLSSLAAPAIAARIEVDCDADASALMSAVATADVAARKATSAVEDRQILNLLETMISLFLSEVSRRLPFYLSGAHSARIDRIGVLCEPETIDCPLTKQDKPRLV